ncbi:unnamed protein product, partial [Ilex paraguariensis]
MFGPQLLAFYISDFQQQTDFSGSLVDSFFQQKSARIRHHESPPTQQVAALSQRSTDGLSMLLKDFNIKPLIAAT